MLFILLINFSGTFAWIFRFWIFSVFFLFFGGLFVRFWFVSVVFCVLFECLNFIGRLSFCNVDKEHIHSLACEHIVHIVFGKGTQRIEPQTYRYQNYLRSIKIHETHEIHEIHEIHGIHEVQEIREINWSHWISWIHSIRSVHSVL